MNFLEDNGVDLKEIEVRYFNYPQPEMLVSRNCHQMSYCFI
jgi:hypothetical protein